MADHPNAALIRRMHESLAQGDPLPTLTELFAQDIIWHLPGRGPLAGEHRGRDAVFAAMRQFEELSEGTLRLEVRDILANDERAVALLRATGSRGDKQYDSTEIDIFQFRSGKVAEFWSFAEDQRLTDEFWS